ncbi:hypothetical protein FCIRC_12609 [Fusarium circinatum]|uniref:Uncharacterized protein n=1 Tax=Fusarium circinatum TaxID=48490 RepID=A0A8H5SYK7_FUSCI|nr:hypothetical protein FCIRC_12609 [Fusarium circinatum]
MPPAPLPIPSGGGKSDKAKPMLAVRTKVACEITIQDAKGNPTRFKIDSGTLGFLVEDHGQECSVQLVKSTGEMGQCRVPTNALEFGAPASDFKIDIPRLQAAKVAAHISNRRAQDPAGKAIVAMWDDVEKNKVMLREHGLRVDVYEAILNNETERRNALNAILASFSEDAWKVLNTPGLPVQKFYQLKQIEAKNPRLGNNDALIYLRLYVNNTQSDYFAKYVGQTIQEYPYDRQQQHIAFLQDPAQHGTHYREARQFSTCYALPIMKLSETWNPRVLGLSREGLSDEALTATLPHRLLMTALNKITQDAFARTGFPSFPGNGCNWNCPLQEGRKERRQWTQYRLTTSEGREMSIFRCQSHVARLDYGRHYTLGMLLSFMSSRRNQEGKLQTTGIFLRSHLDNLPAISLGAPLIVSVELMEDGKPHADPWFRHPYHGAWDNYHELHCFSISVEWMDQATSKWYKAVVSHKDLLFPIEGEPATVSAAWRKATLIVQFKNRRYSNPPPYLLESMRPNIRTLNYDHMKQVISFSQVQEQPARPPPAQVSFMDNYREMLRAIQTQWPQATLGRKPQIKFFGTKDSACAICRVGMVFFSKDIGGCAKREEFPIAEGEDDADKIQIGSCKACWKYWRRPCIWAPLNLGRVPGEPVDKRRPVYPPEYRGMVPAYSKDPIPVEIRAPMSMEDYYNLLNDDQENGGEQEGVIPEDAMVGGD